MRTRFSTARWARHLGIEDELANLERLGFDAVEVGEYLFAREAGLSRVEVLGLYLDGVDVEPVVAATAAGLHRSELLVASRLDHVDLASYAGVRRSGLSQLETIELSRHGDLSVFVAVMSWGGTRGEAEEASAAGVCGLGYGVCRELGLGHDEILERHSAGINLWVLALDHRRRCSVPDDRSRQSHRSGLGSDRRSTPRPRRADLSRLGVSAFRSQVLPAVARSTARTVARAR